jgi:hypothetical protein
LGVWGGGEGSSLSSKDNAAESHSKRPWCVDLIYMAQGGLFYVGSIGFSSKAKIRHRCVSL